MLKLTVTIGADWGCEHTGAEGDAYAEFVELGLQKQFPGAEVCVSYDADHLGRDAIATRGSEMETHEIRELIQGLWDDWCSEGWDRFAAA